MNHVFLSLAELVALVQWSPEQNVHNTEYLKSDFKLIVDKVLFGHTPINRAFQGKGKMHGIWGTVNQGTVNRGFTIITASHHCHFLSSPPLCFHAPCYHVPNFLIA